MPRNGSGTYSLPSAAGNPVVANTTIRSAWANTTLTDIATALTQSIARDGQSVPSASLPMATFRHQNVGAAVDATDYARADQVQNGAFIECSAEAMPSTDVYTANLTFGGVLFTVGQMITLVFPTANTTSSPTLDVNGSGALPILRGDGTPVRVGDCIEDYPSLLLYGGTAWLLQKITYDFPDNVFLTGTVVAAGTSGTPTLLEFAGKENDQLDEVDIGASTFTAAVAGIYMVNMVALVITNAVGASLQNRTQNLHVFKNGADLTTMSTLTWPFATSASVLQMSFPGQYMIGLLVGDTLDFRLTASYTGTPPLLSLRTCQITRVA